MTEHIDYIISTLKIPFEERDHLLIVNGEDLFQLRIGPYTLYVSLKEGDSTLLALHRGFTPLDSYMAPTSADVFLWLNQVFAQYLNPQWEWTVKYDYDGTKTYWDEAKKLWLLPDRSPKQGIEHTWMVFHNPQPGYYVHFPDAFRTSLDAQLWVEDLYSRVPSLAESGAWTLHEQGYLCNKTQKNVRWSDGQNLWVLMEEGDVLQMGFDLARLMELATHE